MIFWTGELFVLTALFLHRNPGHNVKTTLIKTSVKVKGKGKGKAYMKHPYRVVMNIFQRHVFGSTIVGIAISNVSLSITNEGGYTIKLRYLVDKPKLATHLLPQ